jgi:hypothetical protein
MRSVLASLSAIVIVVALTDVAFAQGGESLTNSDIVKMVQAQLSAKIIMTTIESAPAVAFDLSPGALVALKTAGVDDRIIEAMQVRAGARKTDAAPVKASPPPPEKSSALATSKDPEFILRNFRTMLVDASRASFFGSDQMKAALGKNKNFEALNITIVDDLAVADVVLDVGYTFAWDYPFSLVHQNTSIVLVSGKGSGAFSGPAGASSVASELEKLLRPYRAAELPAARKKSP